MKESKFDLVTAILSLVVCAGIAYFITNTLMPKIEPVSFKTIDSAVSGSVETPSTDIFNFTAINPTVEVCVGCTGDEDAGEEE